VSRTFRSEVSGHPSIMGIIHCEPGLKRLFRLPKCLLTITVGFFLTFIFHKVV